MGERPPFKSSGWLVCPCGKAVATFEGCLTRCECGKAYIISVMEVKLSEPVLRRPSGYCDEATDSGHSSATGLVSFP